MTIKEAFFILKHGSAEGIHKYLEAILIVEKENKELKRLLKLAVDVINSIECQSSDYCIYCAGSPNNCSDMDYFVWKHLAEAEKLLEENENEKNNT